MKCGSLLALFQTDLSVFQATSKRVDGLQTLIKTTEPELCLFARTTEHSGCQVDLLKFDCNGVGVSGTCSDLKLVRMRVGWDDEDFPVRADVCPPSGQPGMLRSDS